VTVSDSGGFHCGRSTEHFFLAISTSLNHIPERETDDIIGEETGAYLRATTDRKKVQ
jgi:hypothetical protein